MALDFTFDSVPSIVVRTGVSGKLGTLIRERFGGVRVLMVTDPGIMRLGLMDDALASLKTAGLAAHIFADVEADPSEQTVLNGVDLAVRERVQLVVGFGGGSSMDVAKLIAILAKQEQSLSDMYGVGNVQSSRLPLVMVPTTAGTGSEVTPISVVTTGEHTKMGVSDVTLIADMAVLDAALTTGLPSHVTAATGIDAMVHAIEAYTSRVKKNPVSDGLAIRALQMLGDNVLRACRDGSNIEAREAMLLGAMLAGQAFANAPVGAVHALAYPLGGWFHIPHGHSNALVLPHVLKFNRSVAEPLYAELASHVRLGGDTVAARTDSFIRWLEDISAQTGIETRLRDMKIKEADLPNLASEAMLQTRLLMNNPRAVNEQQALAIYQQAW